jgi:hypothetical protein
MFNTVYISFFCIKNLKIVKIESLAAAHEYLQLKNHKNDS